MGLESCYGSSRIITKNILVLLSRHIYLSMILTVETKHSRKVDALRTDKRSLNVGIMTKKVQNIVNPVFGRNCLKFHKQTNYF